MDHNTIFFTLLFSLIGIGFYYYGKRNSFYFLVAGMLLMIFPYFVSTLQWLVIIGIGIILSAFILSQIFPS